MISAPNNALVSFQVFLALIKVTQLVLQYRPNRENALRVGRQSQPAVAELTGGLPVTPGAKQIRDDTKRPWEKDPVVQSFCRSQRS